MLWKGERDKEENDKTVLVSCLLKCVKCMYKQSSVRLTTGYHLWATCTHPFLPLTQFWMGVRTILRCRPLPKTCCTVQLLFNFNLA